MHHFKSSGCTFCSNHYWGNQFVSFQHLHAGEPNSTFASTSQSLWPELSVSNFLVQISDITSWETYRNSFVLLHAHLLSTRDGSRKINTSLLFPLRRWFLDTILKVLRWTLKDRVVFRSSVQLYLCIGSLYFLPCFIPLSLTSITCDHIPK